MALFGKKKKTEDQNSEPAENKESNSVTEEMKIILAAREEEKQEKLARAEERQQAQEEADRKIEEMEEQSRKTAEKILTGPNVPEEMTFFMVCDEIPLSAAPEKEGNIVIRGNLRGTVKADSEVFLYQGKGERYTVKVEKVRNDRREFVDEASYERVELEITRGDIPVPTDPDEDASRPIQRYAVITDAKGIDDMEDPECKGMAAAGNPRTAAMLCEYGKFGKEPLFFATMMDCLMVSEFVTLAKISGIKNGKTTISFMGLSTKKNPEVPFLPVFTDQRLAKNAAKSSIVAKGGPDQNFIMSFAQVAAVARDAHHQGFIVNPGGPVSITIPKDLIDKMVDTAIFKERFGAGAADNPTLFMGKAINKTPEEFADKSPEVPGMEKVLISNPADTPEFAAIENAVRTFCGSRPEISKVMILVSAPVNNQNDRSYLCIVDCPENSFRNDCKGIAEAMKPYLKGIKRIQFHLYAMTKKDSFPTNVKWLYSKLSQ